MKSTLYFESAGTFRPEEYGPLNGCRIRTAFQLLNGKRVYFEASRWAPSKEQIKYYNASPENIDIMKPGTAYAAISSLYYITNDIDESGYNKDDCNASQINIKRSYLIEWTKTAILNFINSLGAEFSAVEVLPNLAGYYVHRSPYSQRGGNIKNYNYGDKFNYNPTQTAERIAIRNNIEKQDRAKTGERFPAFSFYVDPNDPDFCIYSAPYVGITDEERHKKYYIPALLQDWDANNKYIENERKAKAAARRLLSSLEIVKGFDLLGGLVYTSSSSFAAIWNCNTEARKRGTNLYFQGVAIAECGAPVAFYQEYDENGNECGDVFEVIE